MFLLQHLGFNCQMKWFQFIYYLNWITYCISKHAKCALKKMLTFYYTCKGGFFFFLYLELMAKDQFGGRGQVQVDMNAIKYDNPRSLWFTVFRHFETRWIKYKVGLVWREREREREIKEERKRRRERSMEKEEEKTKVGGVCTQVNKSVFKKKR